MVSLLVNPVREYAWGSPDAISRLLGVEASGQPQAELWMGAHEAAPSVLDDGNSLYDAVCADPDGVLGAEVARRFGGRLPFMAKILAAAQPLSIQAHPSAAQASVGYDREHAAGVPLGAPERSYRDSWPKPELLVALGPFDALVGFRPPDRTVELLAALGCAPLDWMAGALADGTLREVFDTVLGIDSDTVRADIAALGAACAAYRGSDYAAEAATLDRLSQDFPDDPGVLAAVLLNRVRLQHLDAVYLPAGNVHSYLSGTGFEVMANSDNVLRGGLTRKHVDVAELVAAADFGAHTDPVLRARPTGSPGVSEYHTDCGYFAVHRVDLTGGTVTPILGGPRIVVCVDGAVSMRTGDVVTDLGPGRSAFVSGPEPAGSLTGRGTVFVVSVPEPGGA